MSTSFNLEIGLQAIANYRRMNYEFWYALAEFVDNSTQSYLNNKGALDEVFAKKGESLEVRIVHDRDNGVFRITDNSMGMDKADIDRALQIAIPPADTSGRCKYGMGLKTAACWLGNNWSIKTKKLGEDQEYTVEVDVERVATGEAALANSVARVPDLTAHYTVIEIWNLNRPFRGRTIGKAREYLRSMFREDIASGLLSLYFNHELLRWEGYDALLLRNVAGEPIKQTFDFVINGKRVKGWAGVLASGRRAEAGFAIFHSGRVVRAAPESWRPEDIFGVNRNDLLNQRLIGEIHLDDFEVTHTKDNIQWFGEEGEQVEAELARQIGTQIAEARRTFRSREDERGPSEIDVKIAVEAMRKELESPEIVDRLSLTVLPSEAVVREQLDQIAEPVKAGKPPDLQARVGDNEVWVYIAVSDISPNDPYVIQQSGSDGKIIVIVNMRHPYVSGVGGGQFEYHLRECIYDALAEARAQLVRSKIDPDTVKLFKDALLRVPMSMESHEQHTEEEVDPPAVAT